MAHLGTDKRCDQCGAQAYVEYILTESAKPLFFCGNHWDRNKDALKTLGVWDEDPLIDMRRAEQQAVKV